MGAYPHQQRPWWGPLGRIKDFGGLLGFIELPRLLCVGFFETLDSLVSPLCSVLGHSAAFFA